LGLDDLEYETDKTIILDDWKKYTLKRIKWLRLIPRITAVKDENTKRIRTARKDDEPQEQQADTAGGPFTTGSIY